MTRTFVLHSPLDADQLKFVHMSGAEALSSVSQFDLQCVSPSPDIEATELLGKSITIEIVTQYGGSRFLNGIVTKFTYIGPDGSAELQYKYRARLNSWLFLTDKHSDCKIYQQKNIPTIIREALQDFSLPFEIKLMDDYAPREYVVMFNETTLNFVKRLAEEAGIYFYTRHDDGAHTICFTDGGHMTLPEYSTIPFLMPNQRTMNAEEYVSEWEVQHEVHSGRYVTSSYNFKIPDAHLNKIDTLPKEHTFDALEVYEWHGGYADHDEGGKLARVRREQQQQDFQTISAQSNVRGIAPGYLFKLTEHPTRKSNAEYLIVSAQYIFQENPYTSRSDGEDTHWSLNFTVKPSKDRYQPPRITHKPRISGPHSAKISGPPGVDHWCDKWGRVKVQFPWDRYGENDENSSCWIRVSTPSAGSNFGGIHVPRIGHEVIVEFLNGDPDLPIITGSVYNQNQMPPWDLPANASQSGFISRSLGKSQHIGNANALRFEDKKGAEQVWIQAERNMDTAIENDETHHVMNNRTKNVGNDETVGVQRNRAASVGNNEDVSVGNNRTKSVGQDETITIGGNRTESVTKDEAISITGNRTHNIQKNLSETVVQKVTQTVGAEKTTNVVGAYSINAQDAMNRVVAKNSSEVVGQAKSTVVSHAYSVEVGQDYSVDAVGNHTVKTAKNFSTSAQQDHSLTSGQNITIVAGGTLELATTGGATIKLDSSGNVTITGKKVMLSAGGGSVTLDASGAKVTGTLTYIN